MKNILLILFIWAGVVHSGVKYVDNFEKKKMVNLLGGSYSIGGKGSINIFYDSDNPFKGKYSMRVEYSAERKESVWWRCGFNGLDVSKAKYFVFYLFPQNMKSFTLEFADLKGNREELKIRTRGGGWRQVVIPVKKLKSIDFNGLDYFQIEVEGKGKFLIDEIKFTGPSNLFFLSIKDNLFGFPEKKVYPKRLLSLPDNELLDRIYRDTFKHFLFLVDRNSYLPVDWVETNPKFKYRIGDYTSPTNIGLYLMILTMGERTGLIEKEEALKRIKKVVQILSRLPKIEGLWYNWYSTTNLKITSHYISTVDNGWLAAGLMVISVAYPEISESEKLLNGMNFKFLYDPVYGQFYLGYYPQKKKYSPYHYGLLATEPRITSFIAIGKGDVPFDHWFRMDRTFPKAWHWQRQTPEGILVNYLGVDVFEGYYRYDGMKIVPSWGGSIFEFLMPTLVLKERELAPYGLGLNDLVASKIHYLYGKKKKYRVVSIKHSTHSFVIDTEKKDTWRHFRSGADAVIISSPSKLALIERLSAERNIDDLIELYREPYDLVIAEGFKSRNKPKIEVARKELSEELIAEDDPFLIAVVTDIDREFRVPRFSLEDYTKIANFIEKKIILREK